MIACLRLLCGSSVYDQKNALPSSGAAGSSVFELVQAGAVAVTTVDGMLLPQPGGGQLVETG